MTVHPETAHVCSEELVGKTLRILITEHVIRREDLFTQTKGSFYDRMFSS